MLAPSPEPRGIFHVVMIKPTRYGDDGYPVQWIFSPIPSNSLACVNGLADDCRKRNVLGEHVDIRLHPIDECNRRIDTGKLISMIERDGGRALIALVGVQSNQFPRAVDLARPFIDKGYPVCIGGFHVSGCLSMLPEMPDDLKEAQASGISFFAGEAEESRFEEVLADAYNGSLKPIYNYLSDLPNIEGEPTPFLPADAVSRTFGEYTSFDIGRGCPYQCSFCTIINVHGRKSRFRTPDDLEEVIRRNHAQGIHKYFITDDNMARNKNWEPLFDRLIELRKEGIPIRLIVQVDTMCHKIPGFIDKAIAAGVKQVFVGLENINPDNLVAAKKHQNKITEYREMLLAWKKSNTMIYAGYIIGFPNDTKASVLRDIEIIKRELPIDLLYFSYLTPLPGSEDHRKLYEQGAWLDPDMAKYDLNHRVNHHPVMSDEEWEAAYREAWTTYYTFDHMETIIRRAYGLCGKARKSTFQRVMWYRLFPINWKIQPLEGGYFPLRYRQDRRTTLPKQSPLVFYPKYVYDLVRFHLVMGYTYTRLKLIERKVRRDPRRKEYVDLAITPPSDSEFENLQLYSETSGGTKAVERIKKYAAAREVAQEHGRETSVRESAGQVDAAE